MSKFVDKSFISDYFVTRYVVGFCESMGDLLRSLDVSIVDGGTQVHTELTHN